MKRYTEQEIEELQEKNTKLCIDKIMELRKETEQDDQEIYSLLVGIGGKGHIRLNIVITRNDLWNFNLIHYQAVQDKETKELSYTAEYLLEDANQEEMMKYCLKYPYKYYVERY